MALLTRADAIRIFQDSVSKRMDEILDSSPTVEEVNKDLREKIALANTTRFLSNVLVEADGYNPIIKMMLPKLHAVLEKKYLTAFPDCKVIMIPNQECPLIQCYYLELVLP